MLQPLEQLFLHEVHTPEPELEPEHEPLQSPEQLLAQEEQPVSFISEPPEHVSEQEPAHESWQLPRQLPLQPLGVSYGSSLSQLDKKFGKAIVPNMGRIAFAPFLKNSRLEIGLFFSMEISFSMVKVVGK